jgi:integrase
MPIRKPLSEAIAEFSAYRAAHGDAHNTVRNAMQILRKALSIWGDVPVHSIGPGHISALFSAHEWAPSTRNQYRSNLIVFCQWARACNYMGRDQDPLAGWGAVRVPEIERPRLTVEEFNAVLAAATHPRDRMIIALGIFTFLRGSEISSLTIQDVDFGASELLVYRIKTKQADRLPMSSQLRDELVRWINWYRQDQGTLEPGWYLTPAKERDEWTSRGPGGLVRTDRDVSLKPTVKETKPYRSVQRAVRKLGWDTKGVGNHLLRRSGARTYADLLRTEGDSGYLMATASMLGHRDSRQTEHYIGWNTERNNRNERIKGKVMFPQMLDEPGLRLIEGGGSGN